MDVFYEDDANGKCWIGGIGGRRKAKAVCWWLLVRPLEWAVDFVAAYNDHTHMHARTHARTYCFPHLGPSDHKRAQDHGPSPQPDGACGGKQLSYHVSLMQTSDARLPRQR